MVAEYKVELIVMLQSPDLEDTVYYRTAKKAQAISQKLY